MIYCCDIKNNGISYHTFYDKNSKKVRFFNNDGEEVENDYLNSIYNKPKNCLRGYGRLTTLIISLGIISASIGVTALENNISFNDVFQNSGVETVFEDDFEQLSNEELYNELISRNPELSEYIEMTKDVIFNYGQYMNQEELLRTIEDLEIIKTSDRDEIASGKALAFYTKDENKIYLDSELNVQSTIRTCLYHELLHYYSQSGLYDYNEYCDGYEGYALNEGITEMLNCELNDDEMFTYHREAAYVGALCEIIGPEAFERAYFGNSVESLVDELSNYTSRDSALSLIKLIDMSKDSYDAFVYYDSDEDYENFISANMNAWDIITEMYENKYDMDITNDSLMMAYKTASTLTDYSNIGLDEDSFLVDVIVNKNYFVNPDSSFTNVDYNVSNEYGIQGNSYTIDESNRYIDNKTRKK